MTKKKLKVVLAYSGGLDTSIILKWLQTEYDAEVVTFTADLGQGEEVEPARRKAEMLGVRPENIFIEDLREEFVRDYVFPMFRANAVYEGQYLLGTSRAGSSSTFPSDEACSRLASTENGDSPRLSFGIGIWWASAKAISASRLAKLHSRHGATTRMSGSSA